MSILDLNSELSHESKSDEKNDNFLKTITIILNARGTKIEVPYEVLKKSDLVRIWFESLSQDESKIIADESKTYTSELSKLPELFVNFSAHDINLFLDYISYGINDYSYENEVIVTRLCTYFCYKTNLSPNNRIIVTSVMH